MIRVLVLLVSLALALAACGGAATPSPAAQKTFLVLAYADDPSREALLWGITHGKVTSPTVAVTVKFLPLAQIIPAANTKQFDAIEATPLAVPRTAGGEPGFLIISNGLVNVGGTALVTGRTSAIASPSDLKGKTIAVPSLGGTFVLETRYVLQKKYGINADLKTGDVKFSETPPESVPQLLKENRLDAAVATQLGLFRLKDSPDHRVLSNVTQEFQALIGKGSVNSIVVTYKDKAAAKGKAIAELQRLLADSLKYFQEHKQEVVADVALSRKVDAAFLAWFYGAYDLRAGAIAPEDRDGIVAAWEAAKFLGDVKDVPKFEEVIFKP